MSTVQDQDPEAFDRRLRWTVYRHFIEHGTAPAAAVLTEGFGRPVGDVEASLIRLAASHRLVR